MISAWTKTQRTSLVILFYFNPKGAAQTWVSGTRVLYAPKLFVFLCVFIEKWMGFKRKRTHADWGTGTFEMWIMSYKYPTQKNLIAARIFAKWLEGSRTRVR